ncbi:ABC transporter ATP-binding protein [Oceanivirga miroungae]|uniref:ABC transporter domain-containing protein n=1 Tax=Oceanivirga miroungae TaxID=1130046 RepID=A0A6I8MCL5_9FUSO|nr:ABC transporter ATP-binding protein [Oceanivirga miroungae]VWL85222.1 hypothetical protein OMES3154_00505 [Oceanivirga miroungae]
MLLEIKNLNKKIKSKQILDNVKLELEEGVILGLLGPNGSGKTSLMKILVHLNSYNSGEIKLDGKDISILSNKDISYLPDVNFLDDSIKVSSAIEQFKYFYKDNFNEEKANKLLLELEIDKNAKIKNLSKGMIEKLNLILILSRVAKLYILDEPIAGVDVITRKQILNLIIENIDEKSSVIITTHLIKDIEQIFDQVVFIKDGKLSNKYDVESIRLDDSISVEDLYIKEFGGIKNV